ncbi:MAG: translesion DNA synthesis-associated protein ImuA [Gammaproteobacteria bacterium]|nr:translesion DNA synthesis-associated protein ImuA [Gammaproteobacteria bacterium]NVK86862.1 translesion DNA synthesis-associated protein ImuA [Gammaproteobacteria bacterium]
MSKKASINQILKHPTVWQGRQRLSSQPVCSTGYEALDQQLYEGGWPQGALSELLLPAPGVGELRILTPLLKRLSQSSGYIVLVNPPFIPYPPALRQQGIQIEKVLVVRSETVATTVWSAYQALVSKSCAAVLTWLPGRAPYRSEVRKLTLGAREGAAWAFLLRDESAHLHASNAQLRLRLTPLPQGATQIAIIKQRGGWQGRQVVLPLLSEQRAWTALPAAYWPCYQPSKPADTMLTPALANAIPRAIDKWLQQVSTPTSTTPPSIH